MTFCTIPTRLCPLPREIAVLKGSIEMFDWEVLAATRFIAAGAPRQEVVNALATFGLLDRATELSDGYRDQPGWLARRITEIKPTRMLSFKDKAKNANHR